MEDTSRFATKWTLTFVAAALGLANVIAGLTDLQQSKRIATLEWLQRVDSMQLAQQGCKVDSIERAWPPCCAAPPVMRPAAPAPRFEPSPEGKRLAEETARAATEAAARMLEGIEPDMSHPLNNPALMRPAKPSAGLDRAERLLSGREPLSRLVELGTRVEIKPEVKSDADSIDDFLPQPYRPPADEYDEP
jgi:hypothetical protein